MQSLPQTPTPTLPFTYCLFLDDHFPSELELPSRTSGQSHPHNYFQKTDTLISEIRTQISFVAEAPAEMRRLSKEHSPITAGFLSAKSSGSDCESQDMLMLSSDEEMFLEQVDSLRGSGTSLGDKPCTRTGSLEVETTSLELSRSLVTLERKSKFSIWSCISPDLGFSLDDKANCLSTKKRSAKVSSAKLRGALGKAHFERIEDRLRKLLNRKKSRV